MLKQSYKSPLVLLSGLLALFGVGLGVQYLFGTGGSPSHPEIPPAISSDIQKPSRLSETSSGQTEEAKTKSLKEMDKERIKLLVTGFWKSNYYGTRYLTIRKDGTATIYYQPNMLAQLVMGGRLTIHYSWDYDPEKTQVLFTATGGFPKKSYEYVMNKWGADQQQTVLDATEQRLLLLDSDDTTKHDWQRIEAIPKSVIEQFQEP